MLKNWQSSLERVQVRNGSDAKGMVGAGRVGSDRDGSLQVPVMPYNRIQVHRAVIKAIGWSRLCHINPSATNGI